MGNRFYQQQTGATCGCKAPRVYKIKEDKPKTRSKAEMSATIGIDGIDKLLVVDLQRLMALDDFPELTMPTGRLKQPYITECKKVHPDVDWSKLTVAGLKNVINNSLQTA